MTCRHIIKLVHIHIHRLSYIIYLDINFISLSMHQLRWMNFESLAFNNTVDVTAADKCFKV